MSVNENMIKGKWLEIKGEVRKAWGNLTDDELEKTMGDVKSVGGLIMQKYGETEEKYGAKLSEIFARFADKKDEVVEAAKESLKN